MERVELNLDNSLGCTIASRVVMVPENELHDYDLCLQLAEFIKEIGSISTGDTIRVCQY